MPGPQQTSPTILYVDDTEAQRYAVSRVLRRAGFEVTQASSGHQALEMSASGPDLVVLDVNLPDINGIEVCKRIKADEFTAHIPVLQVSATLVDTRHRVAGLEGGADAYLVQPIDPDELVATIRSLLRIRRAEEEARTRAQEIETIYNSAPVGLAMLDTDLRFTRVNELLAQINGLPVHKHIGLSMQELGPNIDAKIVHYFRKVLSSGEPLVNLEIRTPAPAQPDLMRDWLVNLHPLKNERGQVVGVNAVVQEITDRKRAEEEIKKSQELFQAFMDNMPVFAYMKDENGRYIFHNRAVGPHSWTFWVTLSCNVFIPQLLWFRKWRTDPKRLFLVSFVILYGMWLERYMIIITSLHRDFLPSSWSNFIASPWDVSVLVGSIGLFVVCFLLFVRFLPMISIFEMRELLPFSRPGGGVEK